MKDEIAKTREYLNYIEEHYNNVIRAWDIIQQCCQGKGFDFLYDDWKWSEIDKSIAGHDRSKLSAEEFVQYRKNFFPTVREKSESSGCIIKTDFDKAWEHHKSNNAHHWENWTQQENSILATIHLIENICDWMAMGMKFGDTAKDYYEKNKDSIKLPLWAEELMYEIFECVYP